MAIPNTEAFQKMLNREFEIATRNNQSSLIILASDLHCKVGGYPSGNHRMPICCKVMISAMEDDDLILESPPSGQGAKLKIEYKLPRPGP